MFIGSIILLKIVTQSRKAIVRLVVLYQASDIQKHQPGYHDGFGSLLKEGTLTEYLGIPYISVAQEKGWDGLWEVVKRNIQEINADGVFLQFFHDHRMIDPSHPIAAIRNLPSKPIIFSSVGDGFGRWGKRIPISYKITAKLSDVNFLTSMGYLAEDLVRFGAKNIVLMPNGVCQLRFSSSFDHSHYQPEHDVVFIGNLSGTLNPFSDLFWNERRRRSVVKAFTRRYGSRFAVYGNNWTGLCARGPVAYAEQHSVYRRSRVIIGGYPYVWCDYYTSDRVLIALASGIPFVDFAVPQVDKLFKDGHDWWLARSIAEMITKCDRLLELSDEKRLQIAAQTRARILTEHTQYHRCRQMIEIVKDLQIARKKGQISALPSPSFVFDDSGKRFSGATLNWTG